MMKLLAVGQCVPNCNVELNQTPCLDSLSFERDCPWSLWGHEPSAADISVPPRSQATFSGGSGGWKHFPQLQPISSSNFTFFFFFNSIFQYREEYEYWGAGGGGGGGVCHLPKEPRNKPDIFAVITCYRLKAVAVSSLGFENIVPVLKPIAYLMLLFWQGTLEGYNLAKMGGDLKKH